MFEGDNRVILKVRAGSHLYGLNTPTSDEDFIGVYLSTPEELLGLQKSEIIDKSVISKQENGKNNKDAVDCKYYELRKFCQLALSANPTILELLYANGDNIIHRDELGLELMSNRQKFLSQKIRKTYLGYAYSQVAKSQVKSHNLKVLIKAREEFGKIENKSSMLYDLVHEHGLGYYTENFDNIIEFNDDYPNYLTVADLKFNNQKIKDVIDKIDFRINNATNRADGMLQHGLDFKFVSHTYRLIKEGEELLQTGMLNFPLADKELLLKIKLGQIPATEVMDMIGDINTLQEEWKDYTLLPKSADFKGVNDMIINIYSKHLGSHIKFC